MKLSLALLPCQQLLSRKLCHGGNKVTLCDWCVTYFSNLASWHVIVSLNLTSLLGKILWGAYRAYNLLLFDNNACQQATEAFFNVVPSLGEARPWTPVATLSISRPPIPEHLRCRRPGAMWEALIRSCASLCQRSCLEQSLDVVGILWKIERICKRGDIGTPAPLIYRRNGIE